jgi:hypothetical protein
MLNPCVDQTGDGRVFEAREQARFALEPGIVRARHFAEQQFDGHTLRNAVNAVSEIHDAHAAHAQALTQAEISELHSDQGWWCLGHPIKDSRSNRRFAHSDHQQGVDFASQRVIVSACPSQECVAVSLVELESRYEDLVGSASVHDSIFARAAH